ncbi:MAG: ATP-binding protein [Dehalococcoidia bacterium]
MPDALDWLDDSVGPLGVVVGGSLSRGLDVRLGSAHAVEESKVGTFVTIAGVGHRYFGIITDLALESSDSRLAASMGDVDPTIASVLSGTSAYSIARVTPILATGVGADSPQPARSLPGHFAQVHRASNEDVQAVFGGEDARHIYIGNPLDMEDTRVCLDLAEMVKRSNGVFGKSGTGKSFLTRILLAGILQRGVATNLVFDMHSEYGWQSTHESGHAAKGLKQLFPSRVAVFTLDEQSSRRRGVSTDFTARIGLNEIEPDDVAILAPTLGITDLGVQACYTLERHYGDDWVKSFLELASAEVSTLAETLGEHAGTLDALRRRLRPLERLEFTTDRAPSGQGTVQKVLEYLKDGRHVVFEFGRHGDNLTAYLLVANLLTRRIHGEYRRLTERALADNTKQPDPLVITIEEAHRFLSPGIAGHTIFGTIAREMRKYRVTLLVVDQRPSGIDDEVLSQVGTRIVCQLDNERDVDAVLTGAPGSRELKGVLSRLESQQQSLMFGHALPMPVVVRTRTYDEAFYADMTLPGYGGAAGRDKADLFG